MKKLIALLLLITITIASISCSNTKTLYLSPDEFIQRSDNFDTSVQGNNFIGAVGNRFYFEQSTSISVLNFLGLSDELNYTIFWTEFQEVPEDFLNNLQKAKNEKAQRLKAYNKTDGSHTQIISKEMAHIVSKRDYEELDGTLLISNDSEEVRLPWSFSITNKGNGALEIGNIGIRIYDAHDDSTFFKNYLLNNHLEDINSDGYLDIVLSGTVLKTNEKNGKITDNHKLKTVFFYVPSEKTFKQKQAHPDVLVFESSKIEQ